MSMSFFVLFMAEYAWRRAKDRPFHKTVYDRSTKQGAMDRHMKMLIAGICISTVLIYIR